MKIVVDIEKAKKIHKDKIRIARKPLLLKLDVEVQRAMEEEKDFKLLVEKKQKLRDAPQNSKIDEIEDVEELKQLWDEELLGDSPYSKPELKDGN